jgi:glycogen synthase
VEKDGAVRVHRIAVRGFSPRDRPAARLAGLLAFNLVAAARILRADRGRVDAIVAVHDWMGCLAGVLCRMVGRRRLAFHVHSQELSHPPTGRRSLLGRLVAALERLTATLAHVVVVPTAAMRDVLAARGWPRTRIRVIPHGHEDVDLLRLAALGPEELAVVRAGVRASLGQPHSDLVVFAGRLSAYKGVGTLIRAVPALRLARPGLRLVVVGTQAPRTNCNAETARLIDELGLRDAVLADFRFRPAEEVFAHYLAADVCVFPSTYEPFGLAAVEAMALGCRVVVGPGFALDVAGDAAVRYERDDPDDLARAVLRCLTASPGLGPAAATHARTRFRWHQTAAATLAAYREPAR